MIFPDRLEGADLTLNSLLFSYFLIPHYHEAFNSHIWPILVPGWTLQLELTFYLFFAAVFHFIGQRKATPILLATLATVSTVGALSLPHNAILATVTNPLLLEFALGILLATQIQRVQKAPPAVALVSIVLGLTAVFAFHMENPLINRSFTMGIPALLVVAGVLRFEFLLNHPCLRWLEKIGDASYSLYLFHPLAIGAIAIAWKLLHFPTDPTSLVIFFLPVVLVSSSIGSVIAYMILEKPILTFGNRQLKKWETRHAQK